MPTYTLMNRSTRNAGTYTSDVIDVPQNLRSFNGRVLLSDNDVLDTTLVLTWRVLATFDGSTWVDLVRGGWRGGVDGEGYPVGAPNQSWQTSGPLPVQAQGEFTISKRVRIGLELDIN
jgi:hypothetical protein